MSTPPFIGALKQELAILEADLDADPRVSKIKTIRQLLAQYTDSTVVRREGPRFDGQTSGSPRANGSPRAETKRGRVHEVIHRILSSTGKTHRRDLLKILQETGLLVDEKDPMTTLAIYLTDFKDFRSVGQGFWEIVPTETHEAPSSEPEGAP